MKGRYIGLWAGIVLLGLLGVLGKIYEKSLMTAIYDPWHGIQDWQGLETEQLHPVVLDLAASEDPKKLAFAAILGAILEDKEIEKALEQPFIDSAIFGKTAENKSKGWERTTKSFDDYSKKRHEIAEKREKEGKRVITQETLDNWRKMALEKAAPDDVWVFSVLATFGAAKSNNAKAVREEAIFRWQQAEPDNLAPLLHQPGLSASELFERSKTRHQFVEHNYPILRWMYQTLLQQRPNQQKNIAAQLMEIDAATAIFPDKPLMDVCKKNPPQPSSADWQSCRFIAKTLRQSSSSSAIPPILGTAILQTLTNDETEKQLFANERAYFSWLLNQQTLQMKGVRFLEHYLKRLQDKNINSERQAIESFLLQEGLPLKPDEESLKPFLERYKK